MGHSSKPGDGGHGLGVRGCGGNLMVSAATPKTSIVRRNIRAIVNTIAAHRAAKVRGSRSV